MRAAFFSVAVWDEFPQLGRAFAGGNALNQAVRFARAGGQALFVGALGLDEPGDRLEALLRAAGVDLSRLRRLRGSTARNRLVNDGAGERFGVEGAWQGGVYPGFQLQAEDWACMADCELWATHVDGPNLEAALAHKQPHQCLAVDCQHHRDYALLQRPACAVDIAYFGGTREQAGELQRLSEGVEALLVLTLGAEGSLAFHQGRVWTQPALPVAAVVDTTGAGDAFQAAFSARYVRTRDVAQALCAGAEAGREAVQAHGGVPWLAAGA